MVLRKIMSLADVDEPTMTELAKACDIPKDSIEDVYCCTPTQLSMIAETRNEVIHFILTFGPAADIDRFCEAIRLVISLNPALRTRLARCNLGIVQVLTSEEHVTERRAGDLDTYLSDESYHMGLGTSLFRTAFIGRVFVGTLHHAVADYTSMAAIFGQDLPTAYLGLPLPHRPPFKEFVEYYTSIDESSARSFWASRFKGSPTVFPRVKPGSTPAFKDATPRKMTLKRIGNGVSPTHVPYFIEAAWALTLSAYAASDSVAYGYVLSGRSPAMNGLELTMGPTLIEAPVQVNLQRTMTVEWLLKDRATALRQLQANPAAHYGIFDISTISDPAKIASGFQSLLNIVPVLSLGGGAGDVKYNGQVWLRGSWPLVQICRVKDNKISIEPRYNSSVICDRQMDRIMNQFEYMIELLMDIPLHTTLNELPQLNAYDSMELAQWSNTIPQPVEECLHELFRVRVQTQPEAMAVEANDGNASYRRLDQMSNHVARELQMRGMSVGDSAALIFEKSLWFIVATLSVMKAGGVCVPIDKHGRHDHKLELVSKTNAKIVLTSSAEYPHSVGLAPVILAIDADLFAGQSEMSSPLSNETSSPRDLAYITFTSGATGVPKGVLLEHCSLVSMLRPHAQRLDWQPDSRILQFAAHTSGISIYEIFGALLFGGCLCVPTEKTCNSDLPSFIESAGVNMAILPPVVLRSMSSDQVPSLRSLISIGEPIHTEASKDWGTTLRLFNCWGACEASMLSTVAELTSTSPYHDTIGKSVGCAVWIVNPRNVHELIPIGGVGELLIQGPGVARGYLKDEARTADFFIPPPRWALSFTSKGTRFHRTGDLGKYNPDGSISFIGRQANQLRLGSQTIQPEEIESELGSSDQVRDVVVSSKVSVGRTQLVAVIRLSDTRAPTMLPQKPLGIGAEVTELRLDAIRTYARSRLPPNMIPSLWIDVEQIPRLTSRQLDRTSTRAWLRTMRK